ncbi:two-partner secretion domain-containing protein, partial [Candidatus Thiosymbion oneisti]|uniref:two-partner secretion domain-containing protein n=1 Tax=Candidatus Thiosymbion oneisti TaxID=589554 RepID=UPI000A5C7AB2
ASSKPGKRLDLPLAATAACIVVMLTTPIIGANPTGGKVVRGNAHIATQPGQVTIHQHSGKAVINWNGFSIEKGEVTQFDQPGRRAIALNRVVTNRPSRINGQLQANGNVWLINQNGVTVGRNGTVQAQGFLATTADIADDNFMAGRYQFDQPSPNAKVINQGHISLGERGLGALVAPHARNDGVIEGQGSTVVIAGAKTFAVDLYGDDLIHFETKSPVTRRPAGVEALAENNGIIQVDGGRVLITAVAAEGIVDQAIKIGGKVTARSAYADGGEIVLDGGRNGTVAVTGTLDASSRHGRGGKIDIRGRKLRLGRKSLVKASGSTGGGDIRIGGDRGGQGPGRNADRVILAPEARIIADATGFGDGGSIIVYGQQTARIAGKLTARGGQHGGDGGFIETSAAGTIDIAAAQVDASAPAGNPGTWLIDPQDITINDAAATNIVAALEGGSNVEVTTAGTGTPQYGTVTNPNGPGNITVAANIQPDLAGAAGDQQVTLTLTAHNDVTVNSGVTIGPASAGPGDSMGVSINAGNDIIINNGTINTSLGAGAVNLTAMSDIALGRIHAGTGDITITATGGAISDNLAGEGAGNENLVGDAIDLTAGGAIGATGAGAIDTRVVSIDAKVTGTTGGIFIDETDGVQLGNIAPVTAPGAIEVTTKAGVQVSQAVTAGGDLNLDAGGQQLLVAAAVRGSNINLAGAAIVAGIKHTDDGDVISDGTITATAGADISMADGTLYSAGGDVNLTATGNIELSRIEAGTNAITIDAAGAIFDSTAAEGTGNENLVGGDISLMGGNAIGRGNDIDTNADRIDAEITDPRVTTSGIFITETDSVALGRVDAGANAIVLTAGGAINDYDTTVEGAGNENLVGGNISLAAGGAIGATGNADIDTAVATKLDAQA